MNSERGRPQLRFGEQLLILLEKEWLQMVRDPVIFMGALLLIVLIVLFGWGLSMDLLKVPAVLTAGESTVLTAEVRAAFRGSPYFELTEVPSRQDAEMLFAARRTEVIIDLPPGFTRDAAMGRAQIGLTVHGVDASAASIIRTYAAAVVAGLSRFVKTLLCWEALRARRLRRQEPQHFSPAHGSMKPTPPPGIWFRGFQSWY